jgi:hypothetical protein
MNKNMTEREIIAGAVDQIREHGWCQGALKDDDGRLCIYGALNAAFFGYDEMTGDDKITEYNLAPLNIAYVIVHNVCFNTHKMGAIRFNDDFLTIEEDVIDILKIAARDAN